MEKHTDVSSMPSLHRSSQVRVLDEKRELVGVFSTTEALDQVFSQNLDLILTVPNASPPVCRCGELAPVLGNRASGLFRTWIALLVPAPTHQLIFLCRRMMEVGKYHYEKQREERRARKLQREKRCARASPLRLRAILASSQMPRLSSTLLRGQQVTSMCKFRCFSPARQSSFRPWLTTQSFMLPLSPPPAVRKSSS